MIIIHDVKNFYLKGEIMSYQERGVAISLVTSIVVFVGYVVYLGGLAGAGALEGPDASMVVGRSVLWMVGASIALSIVVQIIGAIVRAIVTGRSERPIRDERDKLIELKGMRATLLVFSLAYLWCMAALAFGMAAPNVFIGIIVAMFLASISGDATRMFLYRRGA